MFDFDSFMFSSAMFQEQANAAKGVCPVARRCSDRSELAYWFHLAGVAAGAIARSADT